MCKYFDYKKLSELRQNEKVTQAELAEIVGVTPVVISYWENGKRNPNYEHLAIICLHFGIPLDYFLTEDCSYVLKIVNAPNDRKEKVKKLKSEMDNRVVMWRELAVYELFAKYDPEIARMLSELKELI